MATMSEVIDLCDSDDDEEIQMLAVPQQQQTASFASRNSTAGSSHAAAPEVTQESDEEVLVNNDVEDDDDDVIEVIEPPKKTRSRRSKASRASDFHEDSDSDSDDSLLMAGPVFARKKEPATPATMKGAALNAETPMATPSPSKPVARTAAAQLPGPQLAQSPIKRSHSSDSNDSLPDTMFSHPPTVSGINAKPAAKTAPTLPPVQDVPFRYPKLLPTSQTYADLRPKYILAFWRYARTLVHNSYDKGKLDEVANKIVLLALSRYPVRSLEEYCFSRGVGGACGNSNNDRSNKIDLIGSQLNDGGLDSIGTLPESAGKYVSITEACLVAMLEKVEERLVQKGIDPTVLRVMDDASLQGMLGEKDMWVSLPELFPAIDSLLKPECPARLTCSRDDDFGAAFYATSSTISAEFLQITKLERSYRALGDDDDVGRIKRHQRRGQRMYELTFVGAKTALMIRKRRFPEPPGHYRSSRILFSSDVQEEYKGICIGVDSREGGGRESQLHNMCNVLDEKKVPYFVGTLMIGDYVFFTSKSGGSADNLDYLCPILVERKSIQDIAQSIASGRWEDQKKRMYVGQYVFGYENSKIVYLIEGNVKQQTVTGDMIGNRKYNVSVERVEREIEDLKSQGFEVIPSPGTKASMAKIARWAIRIAQEMRTGALKAEYTYAQFTAEVRNIPRGTDFSRLARDAMEQRSRAASLQGSGTRTMPDFFEPLSTSADSKRPAKRSPQADKAAAKKVKGDASRDYSGMTKAQLEAECSKLGLVKTGRKAELIERLLHEPRPPELYLRRKNVFEQYVPNKHNTGGTAMLVALYLHEKVAADNDKGLTREELTSKAEDLQITKEDFRKTAGPHDSYSAWNSMTRLTSGDPALVAVKKGRYKLTRHSEIAGYPLAEVMHKWVHEYGICQCGAKDI